MSDDYQALTADFRALAKSLETTADGYDRKRKYINRSKCFDGDRQLHAGLAGGARLAAERIRNLLPRVVPQEPEPEVDAE